MARKSTKAAIEDVEPEQIIDEPADQEADENRISKAEAARRTLAEGIELPRKASLHIKQKYGLDISPQQFSAEKSRMKQRLGGTLPGESSRPHSRSETYLAPTNSYSGGDPGLLEALEAIKPLIESLGAEKVKRMVDLLG